MSRRNVIRNGQRGLPGQVQAPWMWKQGMHWKLEGRRKCTQQTHFSQGILMSFNLINAFRKLGQEECDYLIVLFKEYEAGY